MAKFFLASVLGYLIGSLNPAAFLGKIKHQNLRDSGTGNLGATNVTMHFGKLLGALVMIFDICKSFAAVKLASWLFPESVIAGLLMGCFAVAGHMFPFYLRFKGGKGLAAYGGMILGVNPIFFLILLTLGLVFMFITNYSVMLLIPASILFPVMGGLHYHSVGFFVIACLISILTLFKFRENFKRIKQGNELKLRDYIKKHLR